jgi:hypothetical protein
VTNDNVTAELQFLRTILRKLVDSGKIEEEFNYFTSEEKARLHTCVLDSRYETFLSLRRNNHNAVCSSDIESIALLPPQSERIRTRTYPMDAKASLDQESDLLYHKLEEQKQALIETNGKLNEVSEEKARVCEVLDDRTAKLKHLERYFSCSYHINQPNQQF